MGAKRALIVDDSKSARLFLARILEKYEIDVDNAENAEAAIEYLTSHRPDVIFMDHLMPGMDGFQAVQAIKSNPLTATIPIMMYTSQEGELYLGQARALGAVGVLPKQIKPTDVSKVLYQLHLLTDRRTTYQASFRPLNVASSGGEVQTDQSAANDSGVLPKVLTETALREQFAELRRALVAGVDTQTERITAEVRALLLEAFPSAALPAAATPTPPRSGLQWGWIIASLALAIALATTALWWQQVNQLRALRGEVAQLRQDIMGGPDETGLVGAAALGVNRSPTGKGTTADRLNAAKRASALDGEGLKGAEGEPTNANGGGPPPRALPTDAKPLVISVPYGADALGGSRLELIRQLLDRLVKENHGGVVDIKSFPGRFCLVGNANDGFSLATDETPFSKCDAVGNPSDEALSPAQRTPLPFANLVGAVRHTSHKTLDVQTSVGDPTATIAQYPPVSPELTAGEWNRAGGANNRVEIRVR
jgi:CheY-like chemotaxis protein